MSGGMLRTTAQTFSPEPFSGLKCAQLCRRVVAQLPDFKGLVYVEDGQSTTRLCLDAGRIAWVHSELCNHFLSDRLRASLAMSDSAFRDTLAVCRARKAHIGDHLVREGHLDSTQFRQILLEHNAEHLWAMLLATPDVDDYWSYEPGDQAYKPDFTFDIEELLYVCPAEALRPKQPGKFRAPGHPTTELLAVGNPAPAHNVTPSALRAVLHDPSFAPQDSAWLLWTSGHLLGTREALPVPLTDLARTSLDRGFQQTVATTGDGLYIVSPMSREIALIVFSPSTSRMARLILASNMIRGKLDHFELPAVPQWSRGRARETST